jgi:hypothetical protein
MLLELVQQDLANGQDPENFMKIISALKELENPSFKNN